jgi:lysozyme family protein
MTSTPAEAFAAWCAFLAPTEGGMSKDPDDPGNWTGGKCGLGILKGTKYGIACSSHPQLDIENLTQAQATAIQKGEYWDMVHGDELHPSVAFLLAEAAYGSGPVTARRQMQSMLVVRADGEFGPVTMMAIARDAAFDLDRLLCEFSARRLLFEAGLNNWLDAKGGWSRRLFRGLLIARSLA